MVILLYGLPLNMRIGFLSKFTILNYPLQPLPLHIQTTPFTIGLTDTSGDFCFPYFLVIDATA
jgi:hypothetical protein